MHDRFGPNGGGCGRGTPIDVVEFDRAYACDCNNTGYVGVNCEVPISYEVALTFDQLLDRIAADPAQRLPFIFLVTSRVAKAAGRELREVDVQPLDPTGTMVLVKVTDMIGDAEPTAAAMAQWIGNPDGEFKGLKLHSVQALGGTAYSRLTPSTPTTTVPLPVINTTVAAGATEDADSTLDTNTQVIILAIAIVAVALCAFLFAVRRWRASESFAITSAVEAEVAKRAKAARQKELDGMPSYHTVSGPPPAAYTSPGVSSETYELEEPTLFDLGALGVGGSLGGFVKETQFDNMMYMKSGLVTLRKADLPSWGLTLAGPVDRADTRVGVYIQKVKPDSAACLNPDLIPGMRILSANGIDVRTALRKTVTAIMYDADSEVILEVEHDPVGMAQYDAPVEKASPARRWRPNAAKLAAKAAEFEDSVMCVLEKEEGQPSFGISLEGPGSAEEARANPGIFLSNIRPNTPASAHQALVAATGLKSADYGDPDQNAASVLAARLRIMHINGQDVTAAPRKHVVDIFRSAEVVEFVMVKPADAKYMAGSVSRGDAEKLLHQEPLGTFIVRTKGPDHILSIMRDPSSAAPRQRFMHVKVTSTSHGMAVSGDLIEPRCDTIEDVVERMHDTEDLVGFTTRPRGRKARAAPTAAAPAVDGTGVYEDLGPVVAGAPPPAAAPPQPRPNGGGVPKPTLKRGSTRGSERALAPRAGESTSSAIASGSAGPWMVGPIDRPTAEQLLSRQPQGTFVVREKGQGHVLSIMRDPGSNNAKQRYVHWQLLPGPSGIQVGGTLVSPRCDTVGDIVRRMDGSSDLAGFMTSPYRASGAAAAPGDAPRLRAPAPATGAGVHEEMAPQPQPRGPAGADAVYEQLEVTSAAAPQASLRRARPPAQPSVPSTCLVGPVSRAEAERQLAGKPKGTFLIREKGADWVLSMVKNADAADRGMFSHMSLKHHGPGGMGLGGKLLTPHTDTVDGVVQRLNGTDDLLGFRTTAL